MLNQRFCLNSSPLGITLNVSPTILFSDSVDELDDELDIKDEDEEGGLYPFFSFWPWLLTSLFVRAFYHFWDWWRGIYVPFSRLVSFILLTGWGSSRVFWYPLCRLIWVISSFIIFFYRASSLELTTAKIAFVSCWSVCRNSESFKLCDTIYCMEYVFLDNISSNLSVARAQCFASQTK